MAEKVNLQQQIQQYRQSNPKLAKLSDKQILSIMVENGKITLTEAQKNSIFANDVTSDDNMGLKLEHTGVKQSPAKTIYLQSGRKVVYLKLADGRTVMKYFGADGTMLKPEYFKKVEGKISISDDGQSYTITKDGKKSKPIKAKNPTQGAIDQNLARLNNEEKRLNKTKNEQGFIGSGWDWVKNSTGLEDSSDKAQKQIEAERNLLKQIKSGKVSKSYFKEVTGLDYSKENLEKFKKGELSQATAKIDGYAEGQEMAVDVAGDLVSGVAAVGIYTAAVAAAPFTGGLSIVAGVGAATASGALIKSGVKALDTVGTDREYTLKDFGHDAVTGAFSGALAPVTAGLGGAVGKTVATKLGIQAVKQVGTEVAEEAGKEGLKATLKTALTNPAGYEYVGGNVAKRSTAWVAETATDGALGGAIDGGFREGVDQIEKGEDLNLGDIASAAVEGGIGGAIGAPVIGGGMKAMGKGAQKALGKNNVEIGANGSKIANDTPDAMTKQTIQETKEGILTENNFQITLTPKEAEKLKPMQKQYPEIVNDFIEKYAGKISNEELIEMTGKAISQKIDDTLPHVQIANYTPKVEIEMPINETRFDIGDKTLDVKLPNGISEDIPIPTKIKAELGTTSIHLAKEYKKALDSCKEQAEKIFGETKLATVEAVSTRPKGAASIEPKLEKGLRKKGYLDYNTARECIGDAVGARIITKNLKKLSDKEISDRIESMKVKNKPLTHEQKELLRKYIYEEKFDSDAKKLEGFYLYEQFTRPIVKERTSEVVNELLLSMTKSLMIEKGMTVEQIEKNGILTNKSLIERLKSDNSIEPLKVEQVNNYTGLYGLPEFTVDQMLAIRNIISQNDGIVFTRADIGENLYTNTGFTSPVEILKTNKNDALPKSIKASGYRTAQMNVIFKDGTLGEIQFRGEETNKIGEYEHIAYDLRQGKNTLGELFNDFKKAVSELSKEDYAEYNNYLEACYNYYNRIELGLPAQKPSLPSKFDPILSEENMKELHDMNEVRLNALKENFKEGKIQGGVTND